MSVRLNINTDAAVVFTARLERMHRSALPVAIRNTINKAAFDVKQNTMPESAKKSFIQRKPTFFKANSKVDMAKGFDAKSMKAVVGFAPKSGNDQSVDDLEQQEHGGTIGGRSFVALNQARTGTSWNGRVRANMRMAKVKGNIVDPGAAGSKNNRNSKQAFTKSAVHAGKGGLIFGEGNTVLQVKSLKRIKGNTVVKATAVFSVKKGRKVRPKATSFMEKASLKSAAKMEADFINEAKKQIAKIR